MSKLSNVQREFIQMHINNAGKAKKGRRFTKNQKIICLSIYKLSTKVYKFLESIFICPSIRSLRRFPCKLNLYTGINANLIEHLKTQVSTIKTEREKAAALMWDEFSVRPFVSYDSKRDFILGFEDFGTKRTSKFADHVLVFMLRCLNTGAKKAISYYFPNNGAAWEQLIVCIKENVRAVKKTGLKLMLTICDQGPSNCKAINELKDQY